MAEIEWLLFSHCLFDATCFGIPLILTYNLLYYVQPDRAEPDAKRAKANERPVTAAAEDRAFFEEHGQFLTFLDGMDTNFVTAYVSLFDH